MKNTCIQLWGEEIVVTESTPYTIEKNHLTLQYVKTNDDTHAIMFVNYFRACQIEFNIGTLLRKELMLLDLEPTFSTHNGQLLLKSIQPVESLLRTIFPSNSIGIIILINGLEMGSGTFSLSDMHLKKGDVLQVLYRIANNI